MQHPQMQPQQMQPPQMQPQYITQQPGITVITQNAPADTNDKFEASALSQMKGLSITQILIGALCVIFGVVLIALESHANYFTATSKGLSYIAYGIWIGLYFVLVGIIGVTATKRNSKGMIIAAMVLNIIASAIFWLLLLIFASVGVGIAVNERDQCQFGWFSYALCDSSSVTNTFIALDALMLIMAIAELVVTIWSAALCCGAVCRCCKTPTGRGTAYYSSIPGIVQQPGQVLMYSTGPQMQVQNQYPTYPAAANPGYATHSDNPPTYYSTPQNHSQDDPNSAYEELQPTTYGASSYPTKS